MDGNATVDAQDPRSLRHLDLRVNRIPFYVQGVQAALTALALQKMHHPLDRIEIRVEGNDEPVHSTILVAYTQTVSSMAAIYSRLLLEFLGLKVGGRPSALLPVEKRRRGDIGIENYQREDGTPFAKVAASIVEDFPDAQRVREAWIITCDFAGQRLAHPTDDLKVEDIDVTPMLLRTFETLPELVTRVFLDEAVAPWGQVDAGTSRS
ncbi:hypothetical protein AB4Y45_24550 [Paraburkholderia sp. EG287A]|uniref:hypothetical protein n=1 Tax=unclassified Paraburkholderia TaxID=2615204 RepID=UPI0034D2F153